MERLFSTRFSSTIELIPLGVEPRRTSAPLLLLLGPGGDIKSNVCAGNSDGRIVEGLQSGDIFINRRSGTPQVDPESRAERYPYATRLSGLDSGFCFAVPE